MALSSLKIPDIRLLWSEDERFTSQFNDGKVVVYQIDIKTVFSQLNLFKPYSHYPETVRDVSVWFPFDNDQTNRAEGFTRQLAEVSPKPFSVFQ